MRAGLRMPLRTGKSVIWGQHTCQSLLLELRAVLRKALSSSGPPSGNALSTSGLPDHTTFPPSPHRNPSGSVSTAKLSDCWRAAWGNQPPAHRPPRSSRPPGPLTVQPEQPLRSRKGPRGRASPRAPCPPRPAPKQSPSGLLSPAGPRAAPRKRRRGSRPKRSLCRNHLQRLPCPPGPLRPRPGRGGPSPPPRPPRLLQRPPRPGRPRSVPRPWRDPNSGHSLGTGSAPWGCGGGRALGHSGAQGCLCEAVGGCSLWARG